MKINGRSPSNNSKASPQVKRSNDRKQNSERSNTLDTIDTKQEIRLRLRSYDIFTTKAILMCSAVGDRRPIFDGYDDVVMKGRNMVLKGMLKNSGKDLRVSDEIIMAFSSTSLAGGWCICFNVCFIPRLFSFCWSRSQRDRSGHIVNKMVTLA